jgi:hypothetical protein
MRVRLIRALISTLLRCPCCIATGVSNGNCGDSALN